MASTLLRAELIAEGPAIDKEAASASASEMGVGQRNR
jgi:hypothetical protein